MADWLGINSSHLDSHCGNSGVRKLDEALDGTDSWDHDVDETHWFILDLGVSYNITKVRGRSNTAAFGGSDPIDVNIYVSTDGTTWGDAVASGITTWQDRTDWDGDAVIDCTPKEGRYVKIEIIDTEDTDTPDGIKFGASPAFTILDVYGLFVSSAGIPILRRRREAA